MPVDLAFDRDRLGDLCRRHRLAKLELFGSRAKGTARPDSDVDLLVTFEEGFTPGLEFLGLADEMAAVLGRRVDLLRRRTVERDRNPCFRANVPSAVEVLHAA